MIENGHGEQGLFTYWDPDNWEKGRKEFTVMYADLEDKTTPVFTGTSLQPAPQTQTTPGQNVQTPSVQPQFQQAAPPTRAFQGLSLTAAAM